MSHEAVVLMRAAIQSGIMKLDRIAEYLDISSAYLEELLASKERLPPGFYDELVAAIEDPDNKISWNDVRR